MKVFVFLGPTMPSAEAATELDAIYLPPVAQVDVLRAVRERPFAIGIVDGLFERVPSVWHKEILWALSRGIHVFGAASMGALRAAELAPFGMRGHGEIFAAFQSGQLEDDDEVAVAHGEAASGYRATSEAMVSIRATLRLAERSGTVSSDIRCRLETLAKESFYPDRSYPALFAKARAAGLDAGTLNVLAEFVATHRVDQKRADALAMLRAIRECCSDGAPAPTPDWAFSHTETWEESLSWVEAQPPLGPADDGPTAGSIAAEVRLSGAPGRALVATALSRVAAAVVARRAPRADRELAAASTDSRIRRTVAQQARGRTEQSFDDWLLRHDLSSEAYRELVESEANLAWFRQRYRDEIERQLLDELRMRGDYEGLRRRAFHKERVLSQRGLANVSPRDVGMDESDVVAWYFRERLQGAMPFDLPEALAELGLAERDELAREAARELAYMRCLEEDGGT